MGPIDLAILAGAALLALALYLMDHQLVHEVRWLLVQLGLRAASTPASLRPASVAANPCSSRMEEEEFLF